jgi:hypothetical protein
MIFRDTLSFLGKAKREIVNDVPGGPTGGVIFRSSSPGPELSGVTIVGVADGVEVEVALKVTGVSTVILGVAPDPGRSDATDGGK